MTHSGGKPHTNIGDRGQRYEVSYYDPVEKTEKVFGWSDSSEGVAAMISSINAHPVMDKPLVKDRKL